MQGNPYAQFLNNTNGMNMYQQQPQQMQHPMYNQYQQQNQQMPMQQPYIAPQTSAGNVIKVNGHNGAMAYNTPPNSMTALFDEKENLMYIRRADAGGYATVTTYSYTEVKENEPQLSADEFVTKKEFEGFKEYLNGLVATVMPPQTEPEVSSAPKRKAQVKTSE